MKHILHTHYIPLRAMRWLLLLSHDSMKVGFFLSVLGSFEPLAPEPYVAHQGAKGTKEKRQTQSDEEYGEREDENRRDAAPFISPNRGPCCTT
jgi:hypothetical protein